MTDRIKRHDDGKFARHTHATGPDLPISGVHPGQEELAVVVYEAGTNDAEKLRFARIAISEHPYSFENIGQDAGEALDYHIQDDAVVLKALETAGEEVGRNQPDFGQILAEQIFDDVNEAEQAKWSAAYHAEKRAPRGRPGTGNLDGYDRDPSAGLVNISRPEPGDDDKGQFDGPYDTRDPKHPQYLDRGLSSGRGSHDSNGRWRPGPTYSASSISLSAPPGPVDDDFAEWAAKDDAREKARAVESERISGLIAASRKEGRGASGWRLPPKFMG